MSAATHTYTVPDIKCDHCKRAIEDHVTPLNGVTAVERFAKRLHTARTIRKAVT